MCHVPLRFQRVNGFSNERSEKGGEEDGSEWRLPVLLHAGDLGLCRKSESYSKSMVERFGVLEKCSESQCRK